MPNYVCTTCGVQYAESHAPPPSCPVCEDERQYVGWGGQQWTTLAELRSTRANVVRAESGLIGILTEPAFAIGQRALLVPDPGYPLLWDCLTLIDDATVAPDSGRRRRPSCRRVAPPLLLRGGRVGP